MAPPAGGDGVGVPPFRKPGRPGRSERRHPLNRYVGSGGGIDQRCLGIACGKSGRRICAGRWHAFSPFRGLFCTKNAEKGLLEAKNQDFFVEIGVKGDSGGQDRRRNERNSGSGGVDGDAGQGVTPHAPADYSGRWRGRAVPQPLHQEMGRRQDAPDSGGTAPCRPAAMVGGHAAASPPPWWPPSSSRSI